MIVLGRKCFPYSGLHTTAFAFTAHIPNADTSDGVTWLVDQLQGLNLPTAFGGGAVNDWYCSYRDNPLKPGVWHMHITHTPAERVATLPSIGDYPNWYDRRYDRQFEKYGGDTLDLYEDVYSGGTPATQTEDFDFTVPAHDIICTCFDLFALNFERFGTPTVDQYIVYAWDIDLTAAWVSDPP